uniref:Uncharacterized protein n=1 Tax=Physcomitrium patens TaxID=3218 RepID=A0A2K1KM95_PHYPA|nr:hypothetical protein PHYPA_005786 [Physcomitrium patens]
MSRSIDSLMYHKILLAACRYGVRGLCMKRLSVPVANKFFVLVFTR